MGMRRRSELDDYLRGAEVWRHKLSMGVTATIINFGIALIAASIVSNAFLFAISSGKQWQVLWLHRVASFESAIGLENTKLLARDVRFDSSDGVVFLEGLRPHEILTLTEEANSRIAWKVWLSWLLWAVVLYFAFTEIGKFHHRYGKTKGRDDFLRGAQLESPEGVASAVRNSSRGAGQYRIADVPIPAGMEMRNFLFTGAMGAGKTVAIEDLMDQVLAAGRKSIIYDKKAEFVERHYREGKDFILNPFDTRFPGWSFFKEVESVYQFEQYAHSLIPDREDAKGSEKYFAQAARSVFAHVAERMWRSGKTSTIDLYNQCARVTPKELAEYLQGTEAAVHINPDAGEQASGVLSTLLNAISSFRFISDGYFSIVEWIRRDDDSRLFISSHPTIHDVLLPVISAYVDIAIRATLSLPQTGEDRLWVFLDEAASLKTLPVLKTSLVEARSYGVVHVVGVQNIAQLKANFGEDISKVLRSNLQHKLVLRVEDEETQEAYSKLLGSQELDEQNENLSFGAEPERDSSGMQVARKEKRLVMPSEIKILDDCEGYLQLAGPFAVCKVKYTHKSRPSIAPSYVPREDLRLGAQPLMKRSPAAPDAHEMDSSGAGDYL